LHPGGLSAGIDSLLGKFNYLNCRAQSSVIRTQLSELSKTTELCALKTSKPTAC
jgi:hypothetical protein